MSKDWTPVECWGANRWMIGNGHGSFLDSVITFTDINGKTIPMMSDEELEYRRKRPILGTTFDPMWNLYQKYHDEIEPIFDTIETVLAGLVEIDKALKEDAWNFEDEFDKTIRAWWRGQLDPAFYYREGNNTFFTEAIEAKILSTKMCAALKDALKRKEEKNDDR